MDYVIGYRYWWLRYINERFELVSIFNGEAWPYLKPLEAKCSKNPNHSNTSILPLKYCCCGIYAYKNYNRCVSGLSGSVKLWGRIVEHEDGYRAQYAYPSFINPQFSCIGCGSKLGDISHLKFYRSFNSDPSKSGILYCNGCECIVKSLLPDISRATILKFRIVDILNELSKLYNIPILLK